MLDLVQHCRGEGDWWRGLLLLNPQARDAGLGSRSVQAVMGAVVGAGETTIHLGVLEHNAAAKRFWKRHGFAEVRRQPYAPASGHGAR